MSFRVTAGFILLWAFLLFTSDNGILLWFAAAMLIHEVSHIAVLLLLRGRVTSCTLSMWGVGLSVCGLSYGGELAAVLAGPAASLCAAAAASYAGLPMFAGLNLVAGVYNLLPARCLDGGRALELALTWGGHDRAARRILPAATLLSAVVLAVPLCAALMRGVHNWTLLASAVLLAVSAFDRDC